MSNTIKSNHDYFSRYNNLISQLNEQQRQAVFQIEGPVMVIAGPGTGKTQILALRVARILDQTDAAPYNILCLTYTDSAAMAMRRRLVEIIGPTAHEVHITTFHGFCNQIIQDNLSDFGAYRDLDLLSDLEKVDVYNEILNDLPEDHSLRKLKSGNAYEAKRLQSLFELMKRENYSTDDVKALIDEYLVKMKDPDQNPSFFYTRKSGDNKKGDLKEQTKWIPLAEKMDLLYEAAKLYGKYEEKLHSIGRYDYADMILWVIKKFKNDDVFLSRYQEQYQYILVDEFQDTNGAQKALLDLLVAFWEDNPNLFVVGDDDQAIYKFQGANLSNIASVKSRYNPFTVVLTDNYRSTQNILDSAQQLIEMNTERIVHHDETLTKNLKAALEADDSKVLLPEIREFSNITQEEAHLVKEIRRAYSEGANLGEYAIIYRSHSQIKNVAEALVRLKIPFNLKRRMNILDMPIIRNILNILYFINEESQSLNKGEHRLFEIMHYHFFQISSHDIAKISMYCRGNDDDARKPRHMKDVIGDKVLMESFGLKSVEKLLTFNEHLDIWISSISNYTLQVLFQTILEQGKILEYILKQPEKVWLLEVLSSLFEYIKEETSKEPRMSLSGFLDRIDKMEANNIGIPVQKVNYADNGIHLMTAHAAKGLEFNTVYIIGAISDKWEKTRANNRSYTYPDTMNADSDQNVEDERRLFYVAMTRARKNLIISYATADDNGKDLSPSQFIDEIAQSDRVSRRVIIVDADSVGDLQMQKLMPFIKTYELLEHDRIDEILQSYALSVTDLNKYLTCQLSFYFEKILRVPSARTKYLGFGNAVHRALDLYYRDVVKGLNPDAKQLITYYESAMNKYSSHFTAEEFNNMSVHGKMVLNKYYEDRIAGGDGALDYYPEMDIKNTEYKGIPIKGKLDRVNIYKDHAEVIDYKTGTYTSAKLKGPSDKDILGGDYWRQIVFYKILLDNEKKHNLHMTAGYMDFVEPNSKDELKNYKIVVSQEDIDQVGTQIQEAWEKIHNHEFLNGCGDDKCTWCNFVKNDYVAMGEMRFDESDSLD